MFLALRDLRHAKGRFALIGAVVALITVLVGFLSGLTMGLAEQNVSAITSISADRMVFSTGTGDEPVSYADSALTRADAARWGEQPGVSSVQPLGISQGRLLAGDNKATVTVFGADTVLGSAPASQSGRVSIPLSIAGDLGIGAGDSVLIAGRPFAVQTVTDNAWYSHMPVVRVTLADWRGLQPEPDTAPFATVLAVTAAGTDFAAADATTSTTSAGVLQSLAALGSFRSEIGSLLLMVAMLFGISALVVGAFFSVWAIQRQPDVAVLKALGASNRMLIGDALGQAAILLVLGVGLGIGVTALFGTLAGSALPFVLSPLTTLVPALLMILLGLAGAAFALRSVTTADPLTALGSNR
ncbi:ABC transporter substrate-binding protein [Cryobacterium sp. MLB-32]|uniref:ABC transporter permease n=1 Tax=Cryobacterium sp. MLB-32 TaxID=1529318 RepID=UPI0004E61A7F|nr:ABC transporter permease [Cryobacterium sp. MLB-32]KFF60699.1 ABC transporter substrate-binding protein [Cryobacterium sp. MLB-32]